MVNPDRRSFLLAGGAALVASAAPSDRVLLGVIGSGSRGTFVMGVFQKDPAVQVAAICDVYEPNLEHALTVAAKNQGSRRPKAYRHYRQLLADKEIDAVLIATPEHWHHRMVLDALAAGKDIYIEKPLCHTPEQGVEMVAAGNKSDRIVQVGMQRRSYDLFLEARDLMAAGTVGKVRMVRSWWLNTALGGPATAKLDGPIDWEQWQGPVKHRVPLDPYRFRYWRVFSDYSGGLIADQGAHVFDGIHLVMHAGFPLAVNASGGKPHVPHADTPESAVVIAEYPEDFIAAFTINYAAMRYKFRNDQLNQFDGDEARLDLGREECNVFRRGAEDTAAITKTSARGFGWATDLHVQNFLECVRTRKRPTAPMELGFQAALVVQLANLSLKHGRRIRWDNTQRQVIL